MSDTNIEIKEVDSIVNSVLNKFVNRAKVGKEKYGTTLDRNDLSYEEWIQHLQEELMDATLYLEKLRQELAECRNNNSNNGFCTIM